MVFPLFKLFPFLILLHPIVTADNTTVYIHQLEQKILDLEGHAHELEQKFSDLESKSKELEQKHANVLVSILSQLQSQGQELNQLKTDYENTTDSSSKGSQLVVFQARTSHTITQTSRIHFQHVTRNIGRGFSASTGVFTAPISGTYQMWYSINIGYVLPNNDPVLTVTGGEGATANSVYVPAVKALTSRHKILHGIQALSLVKDDQVYLTLNPPALVEANSSFGGVFLGDL